MSEDIKISFRHSRSDIRNFHGRINTTMDSLDHLLKLAGRPVLAEALTPAQAAEIFTKHGAERSKLGDKAYLRSFRIQINKANHTDKGGDGEAAKEINAAYDVLKDAPAGSTSAGSQGGFKSWERPAGGFKPGASGRQDFTSIDYIKSYFAEKAGPGAHKIMVTGFDGTFTRHSFTVPATEELIPEIAKAMVTWQTKGANNYRCRAVLAQHDRQLHPIFVIWCDGQDISPPYEITEENESFNLNFSNDQHWMRKLPGWLDEMMAKRGGSEG